MDFETPAAQNLANIVVANAPDYRALLNDPNIIRRISPGHRDLNIFIPIRNRAEFIPPLMRYIRKSVRKGPLSAAVIFIENDNSPKVKEAIEAEGANYIFIPNNLADCGGLFAKSLCYNLGYLTAYKAGYSIYHDLDILPEEEYFLKLAKYLEDKPPFIQPYTKKRTMRLGSSITQQIGENPDKYVKFLPGDYVEANPGSPGGSIVVRDDIFEKAGGYDPELFSGYSPEDAVFWSKLEMACGDQPGVIRTCFQGGHGSFADDPPIEVYHLDHPPSDFTNPKLDSMIEHQKVLWSMSMEDRSKFLGLKRAIMRPALCL